MLDFEAQKRMAAVRDLANVDTSFGVMRGMDPKEVEATLKDAFAACDLDGNGALDEEEMRLVLDSVGVGELGLTEKQILAIVAAADADGDGGWITTSSRRSRTDGAAARDGGRDPAQGARNARVHRRQEGYPADARRHARRGSPPLPRMTCRT